MAALLLAVIYLVFVSLGKKVKKDARRRSLAPFSILFLIAFSIWQLMNFCKKIINNHACFSAFTSW